MERHSFRFGNNSMAIILPKKWANKNGLKGSDTIFMEENSKGDLVISSRSPGKSTFVKSIDRHTDPTILSKFVGLYYMRGVTKLVIHSKDGMTKRQAEEVEDSIRIECSGFEITNQTNNEIQIEDFSNIKEIDMDRLILRLRSLVLQEFKEVKGGNIETVNRLEALIDRVYKLGVRYVNIVQPNDMIKYYGTFILTEDIADDLETLAPKLNKSHSAVVDRLVEIFETSGKGFGGDQKAILEVTSMRNHIKKMLGRIKLEDMYKARIKHIARCANKIAEFGLLEEENKILDRLQRKVLLCRK